MAARQGVHSADLVLRLAEPHSHLVLTLLRHDASDVAALVRNLNDPRILRNLRPLPYPYTEDDAHYWLGRTVAIQNKFLEHLRSLPNGAIVDQNPCMIIRDTSKSGGDVDTAPMIGNCDIHRSPYFEVAEEHERQRCAEENAAKPAGDATIVWCFGMWLDPEYHGHGIMPAAMNAVIHQWAIPRMNVCYIIGNPFKGNAGSRRVFEKNGFKYIGETADDIIERGLNDGGRTGLYLLEWKREQQ